MRNGAYHAAHLGLVIPNDRLTDPAQPQRAQRIAMILLAADPGTNLRDAQLRHQEPPAAARARARSMAGGATSSSGSPRRAATASGRSRRRSASTVACTML